MECNVVLSTLFLMTNLMVIEENAVFGVSPTTIEYTMKTYTVVSLFSECTNMTAHERSPFNKRASQIKIDNENILSQFPDLNHFSFDVCESTDILLQILINVSLNAKFYFRQPNNVAPDSEEMLVNKYMNLVFLVGYVTEIQAKLIKEIMAFTEFQKFCFPYHCDKLLSFRTIADQSMILLNLVDHFGWQNIKMVSVTDKIVFPFHTYFMKSLRIFNETKRFCIQSKVLNLTELYPTIDLRDPFEIDLDWYEKYVVDFLGEEQDDSLLIIFGSNHFTHNTPWIYNSSGVCIIHDIYLLETNVNRHNDFFNILTVTDKMRRDNSLDLTIKHDADAFFRLPTNVLSQLSIQRMYQLNSEIESLTQVREDNKDWMKTEFVLPLSAKKNLPYGFPIKNKQARIMSQVFLQQHQNSYPSLKCHQLNCSAGFEKKYGQRAITSRSGKNELSFGMKCALCPINHFKTEYGDGPCKACTGVLSIDNGFRTGCIDPYTNYDLKMDTLMESIAYIFGLIGTCLTLTVIVVFHLRRETPIVRSSDYHISLIHLSSIVITYIVGLLSISINISKEMCIVRNLNISIFYCSNAACIYTKSEKIMDAFKSKVRLSAEEIRKTIATQVFTILILLLTANLLLCVLYFIREPGIHSWQEPDKLHRIHYCNTTYHQTYLIAFFTIFQLVCSVQAFRGRNLPGPMNDAMSMVYSILFTTVTFSISFPITYFRGQGDTEILQLFVLYVNSFCFLVLLYGTKCFVIIFRPKKNTRHYFNKQRMKKIGIATNTK